MDKFNTFLENLESAIDSNVKRSAIKKGYDIEVYHGTNHPDFHQFKTENLSAHFGSKEAAQDRNKNLEDFSKNVVKRDHSDGKLLPLYLKMSSPLDMPDLAGLYQTENGEIITIDEVEDRLDEFYQDDEDNPEFPYPMSWESDTDFSEWLYINDEISRDEFWEVQWDKDEAVKLLKQKGYDGIAYENAIEAPGSTSYIIFDPSQVKLAKETTYDDRGNEIPLDKRFDDSNPDIRY